MRVIMPVIPTVHDILSKAKVYGIVYDLEIMCLKSIAHITSGDFAGECLRESSLPGEVYVWRDVLYDGRRIPGWPTVEMLCDRASFLSELTGGELTQEEVLSDLQAQYNTLTEMCQRHTIILWFDACLYDQSMLVHILACMSRLDYMDAELICIHEFPGVEPFNGLGQLNSEQLVSCFTNASAVEDSQFKFAVRVDKAFASQDVVALHGLAKTVQAPLQCVPDAICRWLAEQPDKHTGLGKLETLALRAIRSGYTKPAEIFKNVAAADSSPQYWGDITLWAKINGLAKHDPPLVDIVGPGERLPQWNQVEEIKKYRITPV